MPDIKHLYLPALAGTAAFQPPREAGHGHRSDGRLLQGISNAMEVSGAARARGVSSVPSAWARPLLFQSALQNPQHLLHAEVLQEWRGMMSVLALRDARDLGVEVVGVALDDTNPLGRALRKLAPRAVHLEAGSPGYEWTEVLTLRYQGPRGPVTLGALSPATLVYTAVEYPRALGPGDLPSLRDPSTGRLRPPAGADDLRLVAAWLAHLHGVLRLNPHPREEEKPTLNTLNGLINGWLEELGGAAAAGGPEAESATVSPEPLQVTAPHPVRYRIYRDLLCPLKRDADRGRDATTHSDLVLRGTRAHPRLRAVVVVTEKLLEGGYRIWDRKRLHHLGGTARSVMEKTFAGASGAGIWRDTDLGAEGAAWIRPELYFLTDVLLAGEGDVPLLAEGEEEGNLGTRFLLPFRREILEFFSPEDIRERLAPEWGTTPDGAVTFSFSLPLHGPEGSVRVERSYRRGAGGGGRLHAIPVPVVEVFPDYLHERWRRYYLFEGNAGEVRVTPVLSGRGPGALLHPVREREGVLDAVDGAAAGVRVRARITELSGDDTFPEALVFSKPAAEEESEEWGLLLLARPASTPGFSGHGRVGIDLGTSNTNLKWRNLRVPDQVEDDEANTDPVEDWVFDFPRYLRSPMSRRDEVRRAVLESFFVPDRQVELPIPTSLRIFERAQHEHLLLDYFVSFTSGYRHPGNVYTNIKWSLEKEIDWFSEALLFLVLIDVVGRTHPKQTIELACSYPRSFSPEEKQRMTQAWESCHARLLGGADPVFDAGPGSPGQDVTIEQPRFAVEGEAAGRYFASRHTLRNSSFLLRQSEKHPAVCLYVGGGTTDISVWRGGRIIFDASIRLAGAQVAAMIQRNPRLQELLLKPDAVAALQECREADPFAARLNIALRRDEEHVYARMREHATRSEIRWIRQSIAFQFAGITHYVAAVLGAAAETPQGRDLFSHLGENGIKLFWGGNASKLIRWIDYGETDSSGTSSMLRSGVLYNALLDLGVEVQGEISQIPSPAHKSEAAGGLLVMHPESRHPGAGGGAPQAGGYKKAFPRPGDAAGAGTGAAAPGGSTTGVVSGERIELTSESVGPTRLLTDELLFGEGGRFERSSLEMLSRFVQIFNGVGVDQRFITADRAVELNGAHRTEVEAAVEEAFVKAQRTEQRRRVIEPVFVLELRELLRWMSAGGQ
jgi:hypothetical protein